MKTNVSFFSFMFWLVLGSFLNSCKDPDFQNACDLNSKINLYSNVINAVSGNGNAFCTIPLPLLSPNGQSSGTASTISLTYSKSSYVYYTDHSISNIPETKGTLTSCTINPSLPVGLSINTNTCSITGTATAQTNTTAYEVTAASSDAIVKATISLRIAGSSSILVYGQFGSFTCSIPNNNGSCSGGSVSANNFNVPTGITTDESGTLYTTDFSNSRLLSFPKDTIVATTVWGQSGSFTTNASGTAAGNLNGPSGVTIDKNGNVYLADSTNNRVLYFPKGNTLATRVYGQLNDFTCGAVNNNGGCTSGVVSADSLNAPSSVALDSAGKVYIADSGNHRVLVFPNDGSIVPIAVYGQFGSFTCGVQNQSGICSLGPPPSANNLNFPTSVALDRNDNLYILDTSNHRVLFHPSGSTTASKVYGQNGSFSCGLSNNDGSCSSGGASASNLNNPQGLALDTNGNLFVADFSNNRVLFFPEATTQNATRIYGHNKNFTCIVNDDNGSCVTGTKSASGLNGPQRVTIDLEGNVFIADSNNHRILKY